MPAQPHLGDERATAEDGEGGEPSRPATTDRRDARLRAVDTAPSAGWAASRVGPLRILMVEDDRDDAELAQRALRRDEIELSARVVDTESAFREALESFEPHLILCDYSLPAFSGEAALDIAMALQPTIPFIFVSGVLGEERAVELLKRGASDYVLKDRLARLPAAVRRALADEATALEKRRAEHELMLANRNLRTLSAANECLVKAQDETSLLTDMCHTIVDVGVYPASWIAAIDAADGRLEVRASDARDKAELVGALTAAHIEGAPGPVHTAITTGEPVVVPDAATLDDSVAWRHYALARGYRSLVVLPLHVNGVNQALVIHGFEAPEFDEGAVRLLRELASDLSYGIRMLRARNDRDENLARLRRSLWSAVGAIAATTELRDPYTAGHQRRVATLAGAIGTELSVEVDMLDGIRLAASIHDIGKAAVPADILTRPGALSSPEIELIRTHPRAGHDVVAGIEFPWPIAEIILQHHERIDGSGYPRGLHRDDILGEARIIAVADVVEAMSSHRPYRPARGIDAALHEIERHRGILYDEACVDACLHVFRVQGFEFNKD